MKNEDGIVANLVRAGKWHWNLLGLGAGTALALMSGPLALGGLAIVGGLELAYLGFLGLNPRFQAVLKAGKQPPPPAADGLRQLDQLLSFLTPDDRQRFEKLRDRCAALLELRRNMEAKDPGLTAERFRGESLDRMLWLFLKLLHQKSGLERFLATTSREAIETELQRSEAQLHEALGRHPQDPTPTENRLATSIRERIATVRERLTNHDQAGGNWELACAEIDKTEQQINHLCEIGMTLRDSGDLAAQADSISASMQSSERVFADTAATDLILADTVPPLLSSSSRLPPPLPATTPAPPRRRQRESE